MCSPLWRRYDSPGGAQVGSWRLAVPFLSQGPPMFIRLDLDPQNSLRNWGMAPQFWGVTSVTSFYCPKIPKIMGVTSLLFLGSLRGIRFGWFQHHLLTISGLAGLPRFPFFVLNITLWRATSICLSFGGVMLKGGYSGHHTFGGSRATFNICVRSWHGELASPLFQLLI